MPGKRKREEIVGSSAVASGKPLSAIAAARQRTEAAAKIVNAPEVTLEPAPVPASILPQSEELDDEESEAEEEDAPIQRNFRLCNWRNETQNILSDTDSELTINLNKHTTIALIGYFEFKILRGAVNINGANIGTVGKDGQKNRLYRACVPATHPISKIRGLDGTNHVLFRSCKSPTPLAHMNPLFENLWNSGSNDDKSRSFCIVTDSESDELSRPLRPEMTPEDWLRAIEECTTGPSITVVTGCSGSGKSTFARRLVNRSLTGLGKNFPSVPAVCYMDLDPQKQEYAPGGQISLVVARDLNLSPSFTFPSTIPQSEGQARNETIRAHPIPGDLANYTEYYQSCVEDLFLAYRNLSSRDSTLPLIIDTPSFLYASNFDTLNKLLIRLKPHNIVHLGDTGAIDTETAARLHLLQTTASQYRSTVYEITSQSPQSTPIRSAAELSCMQMQSYFHLKASIASPGQPHTLSWTSSPLSQLVPWEFCYEETAERMQDIVGFAMYSEPIEPCSLLHALNGSVVQIIQSTSSAVPTPYTSLARTGRFRMPYFQASDRTGMVEALDPRTTRLVCTAMIHSFDAEKRVVRVLVPKTHEELLYGLAPERTVFVGGCCDVPEWAFVEDVYAKEATGEGDSWDVCGQLPWVEKEDVIEDMGYLNTVRRVRKFQTL